MSVATIQGKAKGENDMKVKKGDRLTTKTQPKEMLPIVIWAS